MGRRIARLREAKGFSQRGLAAALETTPSTVNGWESGRNKPEEQLLVNVAKLLETSISYLYGETDDPRPAPDWHSGKGPSSADEAAQEEAADLLRQALRKLGKAHG